MKRPVLATGTTASDASAERPALAQAGFTQDEIVSLVGLRQLDEEVMDVQEGPTFLKVYVIPVLLLTLTVSGWTVLALQVVHGVMISLGYGVIIAVGLRLYLAKLDRYVSCCHVIGNTRRASQCSQGD